MQKNTPVDLTPILDAPLISKTKTGFKFDTARDFHEAYKNGTTTPLAVAEALLEAIEKSNSKDQPAPLLAIIKCEKEEVLRLARESTERYKQGKPLGVLDGVPVAVKDEMNLAPYTTSLGTSFYHQQVDRDGFCIGKLRDAGALFIGKTNMHEIGIDVTNCNPHWGTPRNPYNVNHFTGGSSGGSAAVVAAGLCPIAIGA
ncbi:hypothetical protein HK102_005848, partial [Quaeritorhiza haematococci]